MIHPPKYSHIYGLAFACPKDKYRSKNCPFYKFDDLDFKAKKKFLDQLDEKSMEEILNHHLECTSS